MLWNEHCDNEHDVMMWFSLCHDELYELCNWNDEWTCYDGRSTWWMMINDVCFDDLWRLINCMDKVYHDDEIDIVIKWMIKWTDDLMM